MWLIGGFLSGLAHGRWKSRQKKGLPNSAGDTFGFVLRGFVKIIGAIFALAVVAVIWTTFSEPHKENVYKKAAQCLIENYGYADNIAQYDPKGYPACADEIRAHHELALDPFPGWWPSALKLTLDNHYEHPCEYWHQPSRSMVNDC